ncbi:MAG: dephospho-CoA kinase [Oscillospiraceae bacterium]|nr:dephospho-CoA kinase [Oscillospiraceae bacterium]
MRPRVIGLTGQTGAGKSTVSDIFRRWGAAVIDCDAVARRVVEPGSPALRREQEAFGPEILRPDGSLDRAKTAEIVFSDPEQLKKWCDILYPAITEYIVEELERLENIPLAVLDAPTLFESGADALCDFIVSVTAPRDERLRRIMARDGISREAALRRMSAQREDDYYASRSGAVIVNSGGREELERQLQAIRPKLWREE